MHRSRFAFSVATLAALLLGLAATSPARAQLLDEFVGRWELKLKPDRASLRAGAAEIEERFSFVDGMLVPESFSRKGFSPAGFSVNRREKSFSFTFRGRAEGDLRCDGVFAGGRIHGEMIWTLTASADGTRPVRRYLFVADRLPAAEEVETIAPLER